MTQVPWNLTRRGKGSCTSTSSQHFEV